MVTALPAISVVMPVYNGERFLHEAVESVLAQTLADFELVVVDDGSTDSTSEILERYVSNDPRVVVDRQANQGRATALNRGFALARAPLVARLDADDAALPDRLERQVLFLAEHDQVAAVGGAATFVDERSRPFADVPQPLTDFEIRQAFAHTTPMLHPAVTLRKSAFEEVGGYRPIFVEAEDVDLWLRIAERYELANVPDPVIRYRIHAYQATVRRLELQTLCAVAARAAARLRMRGQPDPLDEASMIDHDTLIGMGATEREIASALVHDLVWLAKTTGRAGYRKAAEDLFAAARARAVSEGGSGALVSTVHRARAQRHAEDGSRVRAKLEAIRAAIAELSS